MGMRRGSAHGLGAYTWRLLIAASTVALLVALGASSASAAAPTACRIRNTDTGKTYAALQAAVDAAKKGDRLTIRGECHGGTVIDKSLVIVGARTPAMSKPVLDGDRKTRVVLIREGIRVRMSDLVIRDGSARDARWSGRRGRCAGRDVTCGRSGAGIANQGSLVLRDVVVRDNHAWHAGGGVSNGGTLILHGATRISHNTARNQGGGVQNVGTLTLNDRSRISDNVTFAEGDFDLGGSGVFNSGSATLNDDSRISGNTVRPSGNTSWGAVLNTGTLTLNDRSRISRNSVDSGGGVANWGRLTMRHRSRISGNSIVLEGGGVYNGSGGILSLRDRSLITGNKGDGVAAYASTVTLSGHSRISGNRSCCGGGVTVRWGSTLTLNGHSRISGNTGRVLGGGVWNDDSTITLNGRSRISGNATLGWGGGVTNWGGTLTLNDGARINRNTAADGGGLFNRMATVTLNDGSRISGNKALARRRLPRTVHDFPARSGVAGGVYNMSDPWNAARLVLTGSSAITGNLAEVAGGGSYVGAGSTLSGVYCAPHTYANVYGNNPDDCHIE